MLDEGEYSPSAAASEASVSVSSSKKKMKNKKRFTDEQIRSLESIFQNETKLEPRRKLQLSRELGLHPRQVAIWFQNKRARWKSKQLERDYDVLKANYNALASRFENLKKEKQSLAIQLQKLNNLAPSAAAGSSIDPRLENDDDDRCEGESNRRLLLERSEYGSAFLSDDGYGKSTNLFGIEEETDLLTVVEPACSSLTSDEDWLEVHSDGLFDQSSSSNQWWDFWS